jgi:hypothetical protein
MSALANQHNAINLSQGFSDFEVSLKLKAFVRRFLDVGNGQGCVIFIERKYNQLLLCGYCVSNKEIFRYAQYDNP